MKCARQVIVAIVAFAWVLAVTLPAGATAYSSVATGNWSTTGTWGAADYPRLAGDTATINDTHIVTYNTTLTTGVGITMNAGSQINFQINFGGSAAGQEHPITVAGASAFYLIWDTRPFYGIFSGSAPLSLSSSLANNPELQLQRASLSYSGDVTVTGGVVRANADGALGTGSATVTGGKLVVGATQTGAKTVTVGNGATFHGATNSPFAWDFILQGGATMYCRGTYNGTFNISGTNTIGSNDGNPTLNGQISGSGKLQFQSGYQSNTFNITPDNSTYTGDWETLNVGNDQKTAPSPPDGRRVNLRVTNLNGLGTNAAGGTVKVNGNSGIVRDYTPWYEADTTRLTFVNTSSGATLNYTRNVTLNGGSLWGETYSNRDMTISGNVYLTANSTIGINFDNSSNGGSPKVYYTGIISEDATPRKLSIGFSNVDANGDGRVVLQNASNSFSGGLDVYTHDKYNGRPNIYVDKGKLVVTAAGAQGSGPITFYENATMILANAAGASNWSLPNDLRGGGTVFVENGSGAYALTSQGNISPGLSVGTLKIEGSLIIDGSLSVDLESLTAYDVINVTKSVTLGGDLDVALLPTYIPAPTDEWTIITSGTGVTGSFDSITPGYNCKLSPDQLSVILYQVPPGTVPEPAGLSLLGLALLAARRRRS